MSDPHIVVSMIQHQRLTESPQAEFRCIVSSPTGERIPSGQATYIDDVRRRSVDGAFEQLATAVKDSRQIGLEGRLPVGNAQLRGAAENSNTRVVHQDVHRAEFPICEGKQFAYLCAAPYIGNFSKHFTFCLDGQMSYCIIDAGLLAPANENACSRAGERLGNRKSYTARGTGNESVSSSQECFVHVFMLRRAPCQPSRVNAIHT